MERLKAALQDCDAVVIGAGSGLSTAAGFTYTGEQFEQHFSDFAQKYGIQDMYSGGFVPWAGTGVRAVTNPRLARPTVGAVPAFRAFLCV